MIALLVALVATIQIRSQAEVERSLIGADATSLAFLIDDLHRANDSLAVEKSDLGKQRAQLESGQAGAADQVLADEANRLRAIEGLAPVHGPGVVIVIDASGLTALDLQDALNNLAAAAGRPARQSGDLPRRSRPRDPLGAYREAFRLRGRVIDPLLTPAFFNCAEILSRRSLIRSMSCLVGMRSLRSARSIVSSAMVSRPSRRLSTWLRRSAGTLSVFLT